MEIVLIGLNHRTATVELRERVAFSVEQACEAADQLRSRGILEETLVLSTCNRSELYGVPRELATDSSGAVELFLASFHQLPPDELNDSLYRHRDRNAVNHLFRVAAGLDSMLLGEAEILGQVREAYRIALDHGATGPGSQPHVSGRTRSRQARSHENGDRHAAGFGGVRGRKTGGAHFRPDGQSSRINRRGGRDQRAGRAASVRPRNQAAARAESYGRARCRSGGAIWRGCHSLGELDRGAGMAGPDRNVGVELGADSDARGDRARHGSPRQSRLIDDRPRRAAQRRGRRRRSL